MRIVTLTSDFGLSDPYVASMKGAILSCTSDCQLIDVTHEIPPQDILAAHFTLGQIWKQFPKGTVHLAVVDPSVGTARRRIIVQSEGHIFVGPDNGLFGFTTQFKNSTFWEIRDTYVPKKVSPTFEGRDIFAPVAGKIVSGTSIEKLGKKIPLIRNILIPAPVSKKKELIGEIISVDRFGNLISNLSQIPKQAEFKLGQKKLGRIFRTYANVLPGKPLTLINSFGLLEIAVRNGSAMDTFHAKKGMKVSARW